MTILPTRISRWLGHVMRKERGRLPKTALNWRPEGGKRQRGQPRLTWRQCVQHELYYYVKTWQEREEMTADRKMWRTWTARCAQH